MPREVAHAGAIEDFATSQPTPPSSANETPIMQVDHSDGQPAMPAVLNTADLTAFMLLIVLFISNVNGVQFGGPAAFVYWALGLAAFLLPGAFVTRWLARRFPGQGAPYLWAAKTLGKNWSFFAAFVAWLPGTLSVVAVTEAGFTFIQYLQPTWLVAARDQAGAILLVLVVATAAACLPLRLLKKMLVALTAIYVGVYLWIGLAGIEWLLKGHAAAIHFSGGTQWQLTGRNFAVFGLVILALLGVDIPLFMGGEIRGGPAGVRKRSRYVWWGAALAGLAYVIATFGVMVVVPPEQSGGLTANVQAIAMVFGPVSGNLAALILAVGQITITIAYLLMFSRLLLIVAQDHWLPHKLTTVNRYGVPVLSIVIQGAIVAATTLITFVVVPVFFARLVPPEQLAFDIYNVLMASTAALWAFSSALLFFFVFSLCYQSLRMRQRALFARREQIYLTALTLVGIAASMIGIWATVSSSWLPTAIPDQNWTIIVIGIVGLSIALGYIGSELPRMHATLSEQKRVNEREMELRSQLQEAYEQQEELLKEVDRLYREQAEAAVTDAVTGLPNRRAVMSRVEEEVERCHRNSGSCAILFIDLDHFKHINDTWGHGAGDAILREMGSRLRGAVRLQDFVGRYGGEEFAILLTDTPVEGALDTARRLRETIAGESYVWKVEGADKAILIEVTGSIGVAVYGLHGTTRETLIESADLGMYQAKHSGRNRVCIADLDLEVPPEARMNDDRPRINITQIVPVQAVLALVAAASAHDRGTDEHAHRMMRHAEATTRELGFSAEEVNMLRLAALLHDIGKIGVPDAILHKPGPLNDEEWAVIRQHPQIGGQILEQIGGIFRSLAPIVLAHHERWDGKGYPHNLAGEQIPLASRILAVVDSYDAMISSRSYCEPMSKEQAEQELVRCSGSQFDRHVVEAFLRALAKQEEDMGADDAQFALAER